MRHALWYAPLAVTATTLALYAVQIDIVHTEHLQRLRPFSIGYLLPVMLLTALGGRRAGALTLALSAAACSYVLETPHWSWRFGSRQDAVGTGLLLIIGTIIILVMDALRRDAGLLSDVTGRPAAKRVERLVRQAAAAVPGVQGIGDCRLFARGLDYSVVLAVEAEGDVTLREAEAIARQVETAVHGAYPLIFEVLVRVCGAEERPADEGMPHHAVGKDIGR